MKKENNKKLVLLDVHAILHRAYHALPEFSSTKGEPTGGLYGLSAMLIKIINDLKPDYIVACYDLPEPTYRHEAYEGYKAGRAKTDDALISQIIRSRDIFKVFNIPMYEKAGFEADDMLGTIVEKVKDKENIDVVIASGDMDTMQLVDGKKVQVYTLKKGIKDTVIYDEKGVLEKYGFKPELLPDFKGLSGDPSDNIIGIKGIGEKTATNLIQNFGTIENIYKKLKKDKTEFEKIKITPRIIKLLEDGEEEAIFSKELATIRRDAPIDFVLPEKEWKEDLNIDKVAELFQEFEFRTLTQRVKEMFGISTLKLNLEARLPSDEELKKVAIALWILDSNITNPELDDIFNYSKKGLPAQTGSFEEAKDFILEEIKKQKLEKVYEDIELPLIPVIKKMEERGVKIDLDYLKKLSKEYHHELEKLEKSIWESAGEKFNINSPKQLGEILFDKMNLSAKGLKKTAGGARSTKESELEKMRSLSPIIDNILKHRELQKLLSTYIDNIPNMVACDGRLHTSFMQAGTTTGRMSSNNPNLQNIPTKTELGQKIRNAFIAEDGFDLVSFDYSQVELRVAALVSGDEKLIEIFKKGEDVHTSVASVVFEVPLDEVTKEMRRRAKIINFGMLYGMGVNSLRQNLGDGITKEEAQKFYDEYFKKFSTLTKFIEKMKIDADRLGYTETFFGRKRSFEGIKSSIPYVRAMAERMAVNFPLQGTSADIIKIAMANIDKYIEKEKLGKDVFMLLQVHDELIFEIKENLVKNIAPKIKEIMESVLDIKETKGVKFAVDVEAGNSWGNLEKLK